MFVPLEGRVGIDINMEPEPAFRIALFYISAIQSRDNIKLV